MSVHETDTLIIGGGITSAMLAQKLAELRPGRKITIVEAGRSIFDTQNRGRYREAAQRHLAKAPTTGAHGCGLPSLCAVSTVHGSVSVC